LTVLVSGGALAYAVFVFIPVRKTIAGNRVRMTQVREEIMEGDRLRLSLWTMDDELKAAQEFNRRWRQWDAKEILPKITEAAAADDRLTLERLDPHPHSNDFLATHEVEIIVSGTFSSVAQFLTRVESINQDHVEVTALSLNSPAGNGEHVTCELTLSIRGENADFSEKTE
jgi:Tfp pilus assembly protein PilO